MRIIQGLFHIKRQKRILRLTIKHFEGGGKRKVRSTSPLTRIGLMKLGLLTNETEVNSIAATTNSVAYLS